MRAKSLRPALSLKARALGYLSRRDYSRAELAAKLRRGAQEVECDAQEVKCDAQKGDGIESLLDTLERDGWLSDSRFAESVVRRRASRFGAARIIGELKQHALEGDLLDDIGKRLRAIEWDSAKAVWHKKFLGHVAQTPAERAKQARFLAARGFSRSIVLKLVNGLDDEVGEA